MTLQTKKILVAYLYCNRGGVCSVIKQRMRALSADGWQVDSIFRHDSGGKEELLRAGVRRVEIEDRSFVEETLEMVSSEVYDCVVIFDVPELVHPLRKVFSESLIYEIHASKPATLGKISPDVLLSCNAVFVPSKWSETWVRDKFPQLPRQRIMLVPDIVDEMVFSMQGKRNTGMGKTILWVGKLDPYKNWEEAIKIGVAFLKKHKEWRFTMVTGGGYAEGEVKELLRHIAREGIWARFNWIHNLELAGLASLYRGVGAEGGVLLATSRGESFGLVIHEAMRCGVPVVATSVGAVPEVVRDGVSGFTYKLGDTSTALSRLDQLASDRSLRDRLVSGAFRVLEGFSEQRLSSAYISMLNQIVFASSREDEAGHEKSHNGACSEHTATK